MPDILVKKDFSCKEHCSNRYQHSWDVSIPKNKAMTHTIAKNSLVIVKSKTPYEVRRKVLCSKVFIGRRFLPISRFRVVCGGCWYRKMHEAKICLAKRFSSYSLEEACIFEWSFGLFAKSDWIIKESINTIVISGFGLLTAFLPLDFLWNFTLVLLLLLLWF